jgi:hypothetical protein
MEEKVERRAWEPMKLSDVGHVGEVVQGGGGKLSPVTHDTGDSRKPPGQA